MKQVGQRLKKYRDAAGLSQDEVAEKAGLTQKYISEVERGLRPGVSAVVLLTIADVVKCPSPILFGGITEEDLDALDRVRKLGQSMK